MCSKSVSRLGINLACQLKANAKSEVTRRDKNITIENWLRSSAVVVFCHTRRIVLHSTRSRDPQIIVQISCARACLFNWVKIRTERIARSNNRRTDIPQWKPPAAALHGRNWLISHTFSLLKNSMHVKQMRVKSRFDLRLYDSRHRYARGTLQYRSWKLYPLSGILRSYFLLWDIRKEYASKCL